MALVPPRFLWGTLGRHQETVLQTIVTPDLWDHLVEGAAMERLWSRVVLDTQARTSILDGIRNFCNNDGRPLRGLLVCAPGGSGKSLICDLIDYSVSTERLPRVLDLRDQQFAPSAGKARACFTWNSGQSRLSPSSA